MRERMSKGVLSRGGAFPNAVAASLVVGSLGVGEVTRAQTPGPSSSASAHEPAPAFGPTPNVPELSVNALSSSGADTPPDDEPSSFFEDLGVVPPAGTPPAWPPACRPRVIRDGSSAQDVPAGYRPETSIDRRVLWGGMAALGAQYLVSPLMLHLSDAILPIDIDNSELLWIPFVGPFLYAENRRDDTERWFAFTNGIIQASGALVAVGALLFPRTELVRIESGGPRVAPRMWFSPGGGGVGARASF
ncbi:MAG: hypothetical protein AAF715_01520 [Myxococcota bacterium]